MKHQLRFMFPTNWTTRGGGKSSVVPEFIYIIIFTTDVIPKTVESESECTK